MRGYQGSRIFPKPEGLEFIGRNPSMEINSNFLKSFIKKTTILLGLK